MPPKIKASKASRKKETKASNSKGHRPGASLPPKSRKKAPPRTRLAYAGPDTSTTPVLRARNVNGRNALSNNRSYAPAAQAPVIVIINGADGKVTGSNASGISARGSGTQAPQGNLQEGFPAFMASETPSFGQPMRADGSAPAPPATDRREGPAVSREQSTGVASGSRQGPEAPPASEPPASGPAPRPQEPTAADRQAKGKGPAPSPQEPAPPPRRPNANGASSSKSQREAPAPAPSRPAPAPAPAPAVPESTTRKRKAATGTGDQKGKGPAPTPAAPAPPPAPPPARPPNAATGASSSRWQEAQDAADAEGLAFERRLRAERLARQQAGSESPIGHFTQPDVGPPPFGDWPHPDPGPFPTFGNAPARPRAAPDVRHIFSGLPDARRRARAPVRQANADADAAPRVAETQRDATGRHAFKTLFVMGNAGREFAPRPQRPRARRGPGPEFSTGLPDERRRERSKLRRSNAEAAPRVAKTERATTGRPKQTAAVAERFNAAAVARANALLDRLG